MKERKQERNERKKTRNKPFLRNFNKSLQRVYFFYFLRWPAIHICSEINILIIKPDIILIENEISKIKIMPQSLILHCEALGR